MLQEHDSILPEATSNSFANERSGPVSIWITSSSQISITVCASALTATTTFWDNR
jgi:hypothetical protein